MFIDYFHNVYDISSLILYFRVQLIIFEIILSKYYNVVKFVRFIIHRLFIFVILFLFL